MSERPFKILITHDLYDTFLDELRRLGEPCFEWVRIEYDNHHKPDNYLELLAEADAIVGRKDLSDEEYAAAGRLKFLQLPIAGYNQIDLDRAARNGLPIANNAGANAISVAEHFFSVVLALYRHLFHHHQTVLDGQWVNLKHYNLEMHGKTVGIVGLGSVGRQVARRCLAFGMRVLYHDIRDGMEGFERVEGAESRDLESLAREADIVTFHVPLTHRTKGMISEELIGWMKPTALLVNLSRGDLQDEAAITRALDERRIAGVALDVFYDEPPAADLPLLAYGRPVSETWDVLGFQREVQVVRGIFSPHSGPSKETRMRVVEHVVENLCRVYRGETPKALVIDYSKL
ncbi:NAD(P)-dependent oxidoreductase [Endothiovibrio diazotrophicus]